ncbi:hypothetical protein CL655_03195 [bacterium]|nr:hypothetical protein [bacterium]|tara:strand:- start:5383 stop:5721 length:339 start_codon:yes stop_codon:yes gene_type:complete
MRRSLLAALCCLLPFAASADSSIIRGLQAGQYGCQTLEQLGELVRGRTPVGVANLPEGCAEVAQPLNGVITTQPTQVIVDEGVEVTFATVWVGGHTIFVLLDIVPLSGELEF